MDNYIILKTGADYWTRRFLRDLNGNKVHPHWRFEMKELLYARIFGKGIRTQRAVYERDVKFDRYMARKIQGLNGDILWGFHGSCYESLKAANEAGKFTICELSIAHIPAAIKILKEEKKLHPEWADSLDNLEFPSWYYERMIEEPHLAQKSNLSISFYSKNAGRFRC